MSAAAVQSHGRAHVEDEPKQAIKCLVWDLDNTLWDGVLLEDAQVSLRPEVPGILRDTRRTGHLALDRQPQRPRPGHGKAA